MHVGCVARRRCACNTRRVSNPGAPQDDRNATGRGIRLAGRGLAAAGLLGLGVIGSWGALVPALPEPVAWTAPDAATASIPGARYSFFALGDTGERHFLPSLREGQLAVARGLTAHDQVAPVDALILLGDNFYPDGLARDDLAQRVAVNLVWPYCRFADLTGPRSPEVAEACSLPAALRRDPAPALFAVLGNHDHDLAESPGLQREAGPEFVANWQVPAGLVEVIEPVPGLSLVLIDSPAVRSEADLASVTAALRAARGPWRIVAAHHPIAERRDGTAESPGPEIRRALRRADVRVQLFLSGHHHNLQAIEMGTGDPTLHVISGGGATRKPIERDFVGRLIARETTGFARVDLVEGDGREELVVSLHATPRYPAVFWKQAELIGRWGITRNGVVSERP